ncbi:class I SAM-dependent methyltransferase [Kyrpidia spormannii]|uniref:SAM-dependent methyltransferase n=2 Tax=Kyrpidia spormannii TaxID=2055160 RepID=A0ACA8Z956_9BACL|nr:class I SAM-dependent methyltransferase [Kyrpidia spormannii]CAB3391298.1 SAM-dependent methyltransferase [Kyrpidia spormannii]CAB3392209.1 SAM-dependent methyltransferase [Kyrpidia spormannii]
MPDLSDTIRRRYDRIAPLFDKMDRMVKDKYRAELLGQVRGEVLEVGVGTGVNLPLYPEGLHVTAIDFSPRMLRYAEERAKKSRARVRLLHMDVQHLQFEDDTFDSAVSTCVFCSVPDPVAGLREIRRVLKPEGRLYMIEHMLSDHLPIALLLHVLNPLVVRMVGANVNRKTMENLRLAGFSIDRVRLIGFVDVFRMIVASPNKADQAHE